MSSLDMIEHVGIRQMNDYVFDIVKGSLRARMRTVLGAGVHDFRTIDEVFERLGIEHRKDGRVVHRNPDRLVSWKGGGTWLGMSYRSFARLVHSMSDVRMEKNSHALVEREGRPSIRLIVT